MSEEMERLLDERLDARVRQVLEAARADAPSASRIRSAAQALGLSATAAGLVRATVPAGRATAGKSALAWSILKWTGAASLLSGALVAGFAATPSRPKADSSPVIRATHGSSPAASPPDTRLPAAAPTARSLPTTVGSSAPLPSGAAAAAPSVRAVARTLSPPARRGMATEPARPSLTERPSEPERATADHPTASGAVGGEAAPSDTPPAVARSATDTLRRETALLDAARRAIRAGDATQALTLLDRYAALPSPLALASEAVLLRARALTRAGQRAEACATARSSVQKHVAGGYASELVHLCEKSGAPPR